MKSMKVVNVANMDGRLFLISSCADMGREVWARYDPEAELYELCASSDMDDPIGEAEHIGECRRVASDWFNELRAG